MVCPFHHVHEVYMCGAVQTESVEPLGQRAETLSFTAFFWICYGVHYSLFNAPTLPAPYPGLHLA